MEQITIRIPEELLETIDERADEHNCNRSEILRDLIVCGLEYDELQSEHDELQSEVERVRNQLQTLIAQQEESKELKRFAREQRSLQKRKHQASLLERMRWFVFGADED